MLSQKIEKVERVLFYSGILAWAVMAVIYIIVDWPLPAWGVWVP